MTNLTRYSPFVELNQTWDSFFDPTSTRSRHTNGLSYEIRPKECVVEVDVEVPGCDPKDVKITAEGRAIHVVTPRGSCYFTVGARIDMDNIEASIQHGLLTLCVPKREAKKVEVKVLGVES
jgi:HSP20 family molecular chaperone IbpA